MTDIVFNTIPLAVIAGVLVYFTINTAPAGQGWGAFCEGLGKGWQAFLKFAVALVIIFIAMGMTSVLVARHQEVIRTEMSGGHGLIGSWLVAIWSPGSISGLPEVKKMWDVGGFDKGALLVFLVTSMSANVQTTFMRAPYVGWTLTFITFGIQLIYSIVFLALAWLCMRIFG